MRFVRRYSGQTAGQPRGDIFGFWGIDRHRTLCGRSFGDGSFLAQGAARHLFPGKACWERGGGKDASRDRIMLARAAVGHARPCPSRYRTPGTGRAWSTCRCPCRRVSVGGRHGMDDDRDFVPAALLRPADRHVQAFASAGTPQAADEAAARLAGQPRQRREVLSAYRQGRTGRAVSQVSGGTSVSFDRGQTARTCP